MQSPNVHAWYPFLLLALLWPCSFHDPRPCGFHERARRIDIQHAGQIAPPHRVLGRFSGGLGRRRCGYRRCVASGLRWLRHTVCCRCRHVVVSHCIVCRYRHGVFHLAFTASPACIHCPSISERSQHPFFWTFKRPEHTDTVRAPFKVSATQRT